MYPKHNRDGSAADADSSSVGPEQVLARAEDRNRCVLKRTTSWRYHPRPRGLARPPKPEEDVGAAAAASAAAAVPPSWLKSNNGVDLFLLAAGVRGGGSSGVGCSTAKRRSLSDSTAVLLSSSPTSARGMSSLAREAQQQRREHAEQEQQHHQNNHLPQHQPQQWQAWNISVAKQSFGIQGREEADDGGEKTHDDEEEGGSDSSRSATIPRETQPAAAISSTTTTAESEKKVRLFPSWMRLGSRRRIRLREEGTSSSVSDNQGPPVLSPPQSPSAGVAAPLLPSTAKSSLKSAVGSSFRRRRRPSTPSPRAVGGKAVVAATLACGVIFEPARGEQRPSLGRYS